MPAEEISPSYGVGDDRGTQSNHGGGLHLPVGEIRTGLVLQELNAVVAVQEAGDADDVNGVGLGHAFLNFLSSPTGVADAGAQSTVVDVTRFQESLELLGCGGPDGTAGIPANRTLGSCFSGTSQSSKEGTKAPAIRPAARPENTGRQTSTSIKISPTKKKRRHHLIP